MRATAAGVLIETVVLHAPSWAGDGEGGGTVVYSAYGTHMGRMASVGGRAEMSMTLGEREALAVRYILSLPWDVTLQANTRAVVAGKTYEIVGVSAQSQNVLTRLVVEEVR
jgi:hypothetical protein